MHRHKDSHSCCCHEPVDSTPFVQPKLDYPSSQRSLASTMASRSLALKTSGLGLENAVLEHIPGYIEYNFKALSDYVEYLSLAKKLSTDDGRW